MENEKYRVLCIDGGGLRGVIPAQILMRLNNKQDSSCHAIRGWLDKVDVYAGTSTGGIIALALAAGVDIKKIYSLYTSKGEEVFGTPLGKWATKIKSLFFRAYSNSNLKNELDNIFGEMTLGDLADRNKRVIIPAFSLDGQMQRESISSINGNFPDSIRTWKPKIFHNFDNQDGHKDNSLKLSRLALYTSAAPTYFPSVDGFIDGGIFANNPSMVALSQILDSRNIRDKVKTSSLDKVFMLSLGTGRSSQYIKDRSVNRGDMQWAAPLIDIMFESVSEVPHFQCSQLLGGNYKRSQFYLGDEAVELDNPDEVPRLDNIAKHADLAEIIEWIATKGWM